MKQDSNDMNKIDTKIINWKMVVIYISKIRLIPQLKKLVSKRKYEV